MNHVDNWHAFGDSTDDFDARIDRFENCIGGKCGRDEDHRSVGPGLLDSFFDRIEDRQSFHGFAGFFLGLPRQPFGAVFFAALGMKCSSLTGDSLANDASLFIYENAHDVTNELRC